MPTLKDLKSLMVGSGISPETVDMLMAELRRTWPGEKIYICAPDLSKKAQIVEASRHLPTVVIAERLGVTQSYVCRVVRKKLT